MTTVYVLYYYNAEHSTGASWQPEQAHGGVAFAKRLRMRACSLGLVVDEFLLQRDGLHEGFTCYQDSRRLVTGSHVRQNATRGLVRQPGSLCHTPPLKSRLQGHLALDVLPDHLDVLAHVCLKALEELPKDVEDHDRNGGRRQEA